MLKYAVHTEIRKRKQYEHHNLEEAVAAVKQGMSVRKASITFGVPRRTVGDHANGKIPHFNNSGISNELSEAEETALVDYVTYMSEHNMPLRRSDIRSTIIVSFFTHTKG